MRKWLLAVWCLVVLLGFGSAKAQSPIVLSKLEVDLWPEYDKPDLLVVYRMVLEPGTTLPANLTVSMPAAAGEPAHVAVRNADGQLYNVAYNRIVNGQISLISFTSPVREIQFEYYDPGLVKNGPVRNFSYRWTGEYAVRSLVVQVQQPALATNMQISPPLGTGVPGEGGIIYYSSELGSFQAQQAVTISVSYQKTDDTLSVQSGKVGPVSAVDASTPGRATFASPGVYLLGAAAIVLLMGGGYWYWRSGRKSRASSPRQRHAVYREKLTQPSSDSVYCHQCGKKANPGDVFCRSCGTRLRRD